MAFLQGHQSLDIRLTFIQCDLILTNYVSKTLSPDEVTFDVQVNINLEGCSAYYSLLWI